MSFNPSQPRAPAGSADGGQWVAEYNSITGKGRIVKSFSTGERARGYAQAMTDAFPALVVEVGKKNQKRRELFFQPKPRDLGRIVGADSAGRRVWFDLPKSKLNHLGKVFVGKEPGKTKRPAIGVGSKRRYAGIGSRTYK